MKPRAPARDWGPSVQELLAGKTVFYPDMWAPNVTGRLAGWVAIHGKYKVNVRSTRTGVIAWLTKKEQQ